MSDSRLQQLNQWLLTATDQTYSDLQPASSDASFRRYFRVTGDTDKQTYIVMDAPPEKEDCMPFIHIDALMRDAGVNAPEIIARNDTNGFLLLSDLGTKLYLDHLNSETADAMYSDAIKALVAMQNITDHLPAYDEIRLQAEMDLFEEWYLGKHLDITLNSDEKNSLSEIFSLLIDNATEQPQVFVHRDYHSRNLMLVSNNNPGVIDFQDAVIGPITYDLASLFKDCYIEWPREKIESWLDVFLSVSKITVEKQQFIRWFDLIGIQRHLKVLGIFCRLNYRDGKKHYLDDLPLTLKYVVETCERYDELKPLSVLLEKHVLNHSQVNAP